MEKKISLKSLPPFLCRNFRSHSGSAETFRATLLKYLNERDFFAEQKHASRNASRRSESCFMSYLL